MSVGTPPTPSSQELAGTDDGPSSRDNLRKALVFAAILAVGTGWIALSDTDVSWPGLAAMLAFYALFYWMGAFVGGRKGGHGLTDTMVAGREMPLKIGLFTMTATWVGGAYIAGTAEATYRDGLAWVQAPWGFALSLVVGGIFFAPKMRRGEFMTMLDPVDLRFGSRLAGVSVLPALLGEIFWSAAILTALGTTFGTILGLDFTASIVLSAAIAVAYTVVGGLWSVALTDVMQVGIIFLGMVLVVPFAFSAVGGPGAAWDAYAEGMGTYASFIPPLDGWDHPDWGAYYWNWWDFALLLVLGGIPWQVYFQRVLSAKNPQTARWLSIGAGVLCIVAAIPSILVGIAAFSVDWGSGGTPSLDNASMTLPFMLRYVVPGLLAVLGLGALAAAVMSSVDSSILSASSMGGWNVYKRLFRPKAQAPQVQKVIKRLIVVVGVAATLLALNVQSVYQLWYLSSDLVYVLLFPQLVCALFLPFANRTGAVAGFVLAAFLRFGGGEPAFGLPAFLPYPWVEGGVSLFPFRTLAMVTGLVTIVVVSYLTRRVDPPVSLRVLEPGTEERRAHEERLASEAARGS